jgi:hypothetical protein
LLMRKNSTTNLLVISISWIIIYANCIFSLYAFSSTHSEDDDECDGDLTANGWIFNTPSHFVLVNCSFTSILLNNFASSSCLCLCSLLYASFPLLFVTISQSTFMLMWSPKLRKCSQLSTRNKNHFWWLHHFFSFLNFSPIFICMSSFN